MSFNSSATRALALEYKSILEDPVEGFRVKLMKEDDLFNWEVAIFGPPDTPYQGGYFKAHMKFPKDYPYSPPSLRFLSKVWHPNVYENGDLCISILHPPVSDPQSGEDPSERWNPTQNVRTILLSVISLLNEPNTFSPANVDSSVMYRRWKESKGADKEYESIIRHQVNATKIEAEKDNVVVPLTAEEWCMKAKPYALGKLDISKTSDFNLSGHTGTLNITNPGASTANSSYNPLYLSSLDHSDFCIDDGYNDDGDLDVSSCSISGPDEYDDEINSSSANITSNVTDNSSSNLRRVPIITNSSFAATHQQLNPTTSTTSNDQHSSNTSHIS